MSHEFDFTDDEEVVPWYADQEAAEGALGDASGRADGQVAAKLPAHPSAAGGASLVKSAGPTTHSVSERRDIAMRDGAPEVIGVARKRETSRPGQATSGASEAEGEHVARKDAPPPSALQKKSSLGKKEAKLTGSAAVLDEKGVASLPGGGTLEWSYAALKVSGEASASAEVAATHSGDKGAGLGAEAAAGVKARANLGELDIKASWSPKLNVLGEGFTFEPVFGLKAMVGAEAAVSTKASVAGSAKADGAPDFNGMKAEAEAFAGAKASVGAGARALWDKKAASSYQARLAALFQGVLVGAVSTGLGPIAGGAVGYISDVLGVDVLAARAVKACLDWGQTGPTPLLGVYIEGEASAGIGAKASATAGLSKGKVEFDVDASATLGVGAGVNVKVELDALQALYCALVMGGALLERHRGPIEDWLKARLAACWDEINALGEALWDWLDDDNKARDLVARGVHRDMAAVDRAHLIDRMMDWAVANGSEDAIVEVLSFSLDKGDLRAVFDAMETKAVALWKAIDGDQARALNRQIDVTQVGCLWKTHVGVLRYPQGRGRVWRDEGATRPYLYFNGEYNADASKVSFPSTTDRSYNTIDPDWTHFLQFNCPSDVVFDDFKCESSAFLDAGFKTLEQAERYRLDSHGVWMADAQKDFARR